MLAARNTAPAHPRVVNAMKPLAVVVLLLIPVLVMFALLPGARLIVPQIPVVLTLVLIMLMTQKMSVAEQLVTSAMPVTVGVAALAWLLLVFLLAANAKLVWLALVLPLMRAAGAVLLGKLVLIPPLATRGFISINVPAVAVRALI